MAVNAITVDQRVIDIDSRRFASIEKALVELITNSDDSYTRLERAGQKVTGPDRRRPWPATSATVPSPSVARPR